MLPLHAQIHISKLAEEKKVEVQERALIDLAFSNISMGNPLHTLLQWNAPFATCGKAGGPCGHGMGVDLMSSQKALRSHEKKSRARANIELKTGNWSIEMDLIPYKL